MARFTQGMTCILTDIMRQFDRLELCRVLRWCILKQILLFINPDHHNIETLSLLRSTSSFIVKNNEFLCNHVIIWLANFNCLCVSSNCPLYMHNNCCQLIRLDYSYQQLLDKRNNLITHNSIMHLNGKHQQLITNSHIWVYAFWACHMKPVKSGKY